MFRGLGRLSTLGRATSYPRSFFSGRSFTVRFDWAESARLSSYSERQKNFSDILGKSGLTAVLAELESALPLNSRLKKSSPSIRGVRLLTFRLCAISLPASGPNEWVGLRPRGVTSVRRMKEDTGSD